MAEYILFEVRMADKLSSELWIKIFQYLTPIDLCFTVPLVNKLFYQISADNQIWKQFIIQSWAENTIATNKKRSFFIKKSSSEKIFKLLYINWMREQVKIAIENKLLPNWLQVDKIRVLKLLVLGEIYSQEYPALTSPLLKNKSPMVFSTDADITTLFTFINREKLNVTLTDFEYYYFSRMSMEHYIQRSVAQAKGILYCVGKFSEQEKMRVEHIKRKLNEVSPLESHIMLLDYTQFAKGSKDANSPQEIIDPNFKEWVKLQEGLEFVEFADVENALDNMVKILERKYSELYLKYLPTRDEFKKYAYDPQKDTTTIKITASPNPILAALKKLFSKAV